MGVGVGVEVEVVEGAAVTICSSSCRVVENW